MMQQFRYNALTSGGEQVSGFLEGISRAAVIEQVSEMGLTPLAVTTSKKNLWERLTEEREMARNYGEKQQATLCRSLSRFLEAGLKLERALTLAAEMAHTKQERKVIKALNLSVRKGATLAGSMAAITDHFPEDMIAQVSAGERTGTLTSVMTSLATSLERTLAFKSRVTSALIYPAILMIVVVLTLILVVGVVLPQFAPLFEASGKELPLLTQVVMAFGNALTGYWWLWVLLVIAAVLATLAVKRDKALMQQWHKKLLLKAWTRQMVVMPDFIRLARGWGSGLESGLPADESLSLALVSLHNAALRQEMQGLLKALRQGARIGHILKETASLPVILKQLALAGDETGRLGAMLMEAANLMESDYEERLERMSGLLAPILTLVSGGIVALLVLAVMMGMMSINDLAI